MSRSALEVQQAIRMQSTDLSDALASLNAWEDDIEQRNRHATRERPSYSVPIRGTAPPSTGTASSANDDSSTNAAPTSATAAAERAKEQGNEQFRRGNTADAINFYTKGIEANGSKGPSCHLLYANRAMCHLKLSDWGSAEVDATRCIELNKSYTKAFFRRAIARKHLGKLSEARTDFETVLAYNPKDAETAAEIKAVTLLIHQKEQQQQQTVVADNSKSSSHNNSSSDVAQGGKKLVIEEVEDEEEEEGGVVQAKEGEDVKNKLKKEDDTEHDPPTAAANTTTTASPPETAKHTDATKLPKGTETTSSTPDSSSNARNDSNNIPQKSGVTVLPDDDDNTLRTAAAAPTNNNDTSDAPPTTTRTAATLPNPSKEENGDNNAPISKPSPTPPAQSTKIHTTAANKPTEHDLRGPPRNFSEFERQYQEIVDDKPLLLKYFASMPPASFGRLFSTTITSEILVDVARYASSQQTSSAVAYAVLTSISAVERLDEIVMFLSDDEGGIVKDAIQHAAAAGHPMQIIQQALSA